MSSSKSSMPKGKKAEKNVSERTSFDEEIAKSLQFIEDFDITDNISSNKGKTQRSRGMNSNRLIKNMNNTKSNYRRHKRSLQKFTPPPSAVAAPAPAAAPAPSVPSLKGHIFEPTVYSNEGDSYTEEDREVWEQKLKDSILYKIV